MTADKLIDFMRRLVYDTKKKVFYLPPYAPQYNPDELLNSDLKRGISKRPSPRADHELEHNVRSQLKQTQLQSDKIRSFFAASFTKYAAYNTQCLIGGAIITIEIHIDKCMPIWYI